MFSTMNPLASSPHRDVLEAVIPMEIDSDNCDAAAVAASAERLVEECKSRAKNCVASKNWMDAKLLYEKAIAVLEKQKNYDASACAALYSNASLCDFNMGEFQKARNAAQTAVTLDPSYVKGYWRLAQAQCQMKDYGPAVQAHETALIHDPTNKAIQKELNKCKELLLQYQKQQAEKQAQAKADEDAAADAHAHAHAATLQPTKTSSDTTPITTTKATTTKKAKNTNTTNANDDKMDIDEDDAGFTKSDHIKGYKIVNGKKTSFFHNELDEKTKELIGDIAPKRLDVVDTNIAPSGSTSSAVGSVWNKAGTWEEKDVTAWAKETLTERLLTTTSVRLEDSSPAPGAMVQITAVPTCDGHASFAMVRGKKRYIYEFSIKLEWSFVHEEPTTPDSDKGAACGTMTFPDFDGTCELGEGYDMAAYTVKESSSSSLTPLLDRFVKNGGLRDSIHKCLDDWVRLFRDTY